MWTFKDAQELIVGLQPEAKKHGYHVALGGGVLNKGESTKDLDLYFLPLDNATYPSNEIGLCMWLGSLFGMGTKIEPGMYSKDTTLVFGQARLAAPFRDYGDGTFASSRKKSKYAQKLMFTLGKRRIDVFII